MNYQRIYQRISNSMVDFRIECWDFEDEAQFEELKRLLHHLAIGHICYADTVNVSPIEELYSPVINEARRLMDQQGYDIGRAFNFGSLDVSVLKPDIKRAYNFGSLDVSVLKPDICDWQAVDLYFCRPSITWDDYLYTHYHRDFGYRIMMNIDGIDSCFLTGNNDIARVIIKRSFSDAIDVFLSNMKDLGFDILKD